MEAVQPVRPIAPYVGGKRALAKRLVERIEQIPHDLYAEPFVGEDVHERLCGVDIERQPYAELIARYDRPGTLFYPDPPYHGNEEDYGQGVFSAADFERLSGLLEGIEGRFVMSINDTSEIRQLFTRFTIEEVGVNYRLSGKVTPARELIISGRKEAA